MLPSHINLLSSLPETDFSRSLRSSLSLNFSLSLSSLYFSLFFSFSFLLEINIILPIWRSRSSTNTILYSYISGVFTYNLPRSQKKMNQCAIQQNSSFGECEEIWGIRSGDKKETVVCPKPRRLGLIHHISEPAYARPPLRWHMSHQPEDYDDAKAGNELLDIILTKGGCAADQSLGAQVASSPPFFSGSPPSRVSNPLIQDARFGDDKFTPVSPRSIPVPSGLAPAPSSSARKVGSCVRGSFGSNPAVRVEGFDCLDRDRRNCSIPALA